MSTDMSRRTFLQATGTGCALCMSGLQSLPCLAATGNPLISPGCRRSKVKVARVYMGVPQGWAWPRPDLDAAKEIRFYNGKFAEMKSDFVDVDFVINELVSTADHAASLATKATDVDGVLVIHLSMGAEQVLPAILGWGKPTVVFAVPYSGHQWSGFGALQNQPLGAKFEALLTSDYRQLALAIRPFRAIHHLREAKILNITTRPIGKYGEDVKAKFGTEIKAIDLKQTMDAVNAISQAEAQAEANRWIAGAEKVVEPSKDEIFKSCRLALAFERLLAEEDATVLTADCYGTMYKSLCLAYAFPCIGFTRLNDLGFGGICESDLSCAMTHIIFQGLSGRPGFISDPTVDESGNSIILAHCLGTRKMDGPDGETAPYKLRSVMERQAGAVPQVQMRKGQKVTQGILVGLDQMPYFTGEIVDAPVGLEVDRGCRTKIRVRVDGNVTRLWKNWSAGLHRQTVYGDITKELGFFARFTGIKLTNEAT
ncbi:MAG: hypothetical protein JXA82_10760 [Sedimentisphaerales bacterium]|nr:hypothetical protein [Sedimentisphaerales bacterium]